jgi:hypothetical protein
MGLNGKCFALSGNQDFPCNIDAITSVSLGIGAGFCALVFVVYLLREVRFGGWTALLVVHVSCTVFLPSMTDAVHGRCTSRLLSITGCRMRMFPSLLTLYLFFLFFLFFFA